MKEEQVDELIDLMQQYELSMAALYEAFAAGVPPDSRAMFEELANEERLHAKWIGDLHARLKRKKATFADSTRFTLQSVKTGLGFLEEQVRRAKRHGQGLAEALNIAINMEKSLLERGFFKAFKLEGPDVQSVQSNLEDATKTHLDKLIARKQTLLGKTEQ